MLICYERTGTVVIRVRVPFTDFPLEGIKLYFTNNTICLPSEIASLLAKVLSLTRRSHNHDPHR